VRARSDKTEIAYLRGVLRNARACLLVQLDPAATPEFKASFATEMRWQIDRMLAPKLRRRARSQP
jgi:hypothetical protein